MADRPVKWIPKKIGTSVEYRSGQTPKAEELNSWFNLLINQGDWNADRITDLLNTEEIRKDLSEEALSTIQSHIEEAQLTYAELVEFYSDVAQTLDDVAATEALRQAVEAARVTAESQRQANTATAIADAELATQSANTAADRVDNTIADAELATSEAVTATTNADVAAAEANDAAANAIDTAQNLETIYGPRLTDVEDEISLVRGEVTSLEDSFDSHKEDYANYQSNNNLKIAAVEKSLNDYKSTIASVNVNQEAKQSASGYGVVSLPKNAANGNVGTSIKGETRTNLCPEILQSEGQPITSIFPYGFEAKFDEQISAIYMNEKFKQGALTISFNENLADGKELLIILRKTSYSDTVGQLSYRYSKGSGSFTFNIPSDDYNYLLFARAGTTLTGDVRVENILIEYTGVRKPFITGTKSTQSAMRLKSVSEDETQESVIYLPNVGELRSLPNGVKDEIRVSGGKAELIKRIGEYAIQRKDLTEIKTDKANINHIVVQLPSDYAMGQTIASALYIPSIPLGQATIHNMDDISYAGMWGGHASAFGNFGYVFSKSTTLEQVEGDLIGAQLFYQLAEPIEIPIETSGMTLSNPSGTVYVENVVVDAGIYIDKLNVLDSGLPIDHIEKLSKVDFNTGVETELDSSKCVIAEDKLSFTHPDLVAHDIVFFTYSHSVETTQGEATIEYYDSRHTLKDSVTGKFYKVVPAVADGVLTNQLVEV